MATTSVLGVMKEVTRLSSKSRTPSTISRSECSKIPDSAPWAMRTFTSSSVTSGPFDLERPSRRTIREVVQERNLTRGSKSLPNTTRGRITIAAMVSGRESAKFLGTSSPRTTDRRVVPTTTVPTEIGEAKGASKGMFENHSPKRLEIVAPPIAPVRMPIKVMATWMEDRNFPGSSAARRARR
ncbi:MAG: hypothetical protein FD137_2629 [Spirochaetes bacterium]|nr:MAG: hypothetical protein FD137_2629 [Spirochaetota bacterium]